MTEILSNKIFHAIFIPIIFIFIGCFTIRLGRHEYERVPIVNDLAVGTITILSILGSIASDVIEVKIINDYLNIFAWFVSVLFILFISIENDRFRSWERNNMGIPVNPSKKNLIWGVILPNLISLIIFTTYLYSKVKNT